MQERMEGKEANSEFLCEYGTGTWEEDAGVNVCFLLWEMLEHVGVIMNVI